jgi:tRNA A-37 threonylcarbamoyl transferase component Bud32/tetratricopeptide (TPR) repeat protein
MNDRVQDLFHEIADLPSESRARYFAERGIPPEAQREVEGLLAFDSGASAYLEQAIGDAAALAMARLDIRDQRCGPYRLLERIGQGGMGAVYLAERDDGEVTQRVAIKLLHPGSADPWRRERFLQERQILASLSHANIARLLDAGRREDGQPFLVMEYIDGRPIDVFTAGAGVRSVVTLFLKVCGAVSYLHRNLVVHRDLKPSNILVTADGEPKLLDFGIAKILDLNTGATMTMMRVLTPDYASPEQVMGGRVNTAADVYSLGAVLHKLLTGRSPHQFSEATPEAVASMICEREIASPSQWAPALKGDLELILMKALRKDPQERYTTADQFAADLENFLGSRPILARKGNLAYRAGKFARRYWLPLTASLLTVGGLVAGSYMANRERAIAQQRFMEVRQLSSKLFDIDAQVRELPGSTKTRQFIVDTSLDYLRRVSAGAQRDPALALELGNAYMRVARVQGVPISANLGQMDPAEQTLRSADGLIQSALASQPANRLAMLRAAQVAHDRMLLARYQGGRGDEVQVFAKKSADWMERLNPGLGDRSEGPAIMVTLSNVADAFRREGQYDDALRISRRGSEFARSVDSRPYLGLFLKVSAQVLQETGDLEEAYKAIHESVGLLEPAPGNTNQGQRINFLLVLTIEGMILGGDQGLSLGRAKEALGPLERAFRIADEAVHRDPIDQGVRGSLENAGRELAHILRHSDPRPALDVYDHTLQHLAEIPDNPSFRRYEAENLAGSSYPLQRLGRSHEARQRLGAAFERLRAQKLYPADKVSPGSVTYRALRALADFEGANGNIPRALEIYRDLLRLLHAGGIDPNSSLKDAMDLSNIYSATAKLHRLNHAPQQADEISALRLDLWRGWDRKLPGNPFVRHQIEATTRR